MTFLLPAGIKALNQNFISLNCLSGWFPALLSNFRETKTSGQLFKACFRLFEQTPTCFKQVAPCFELAEAFFDGIVSWFLEILVSKIILNDKCCLKQAPACSETCARLFKAVTSLFWNKNLSTLK